LKTFDQVRVAGFSPDGATMFTVHGATVSLYRAVDGSDAGRVNGSVLRQAVIGPDGTFLAAGSDDGRRVEMWDTQTPSKSLGSISTGGPVLRVLLSGDGKWLAAVSDTPAPAPGFKLWSIDASKTAVAYDRLGMDVLDVKILSAQFFGSAQPMEPLGLITGSSDGVVRVWTCKASGEWQLVSSLRGHSGPVLDVAISRDMQKMASVGDDSTVRLWIRDPGDVIKSPSWHPLSIARGHKGKVSKVRFAADGHHVVTIGEDGSAMLWNVEPEAEIATAMPRFNRNFLDSGPPRVELIRNGPAALFSDRDVTLLEKGLEPVCGVLAFVSAPVTSPDGRHQVTGDRDGVVKVLDTRTGEVLSEIRDHTCHVTAIAFSRDGKVFATSSADGTLRLYALRVPELVALARSRFPVVR
jgi:WD40 repeat protein